MSLFKFFQTTKNEPYSTGPRVRAGVQTTKKDLTVAVSRSPAE